jgi:antitoxin (DNA-binding transcriptional repressor) of toxin-antitoxin stability system
MREAKTHLSRLVERAQQGEEVVITFGREKRPVARIVAYKPEWAKGRRAGLFKGIFTVGPEFFKPLPDEELRLWDGEQE